MITLSRPSLHPLSSSIILPREKVLRPEVAETTALGAAFAAGLAVGVWSDCEELSRTWVVRDQYESAMEAGTRETVMREPFTVMSVFHLYFNFVYLNQVEFVLLHGVCFVRNLDNNLTPLGRTGGVCATRVFRW